MDRRPPTPPGPQREVPAGARLQSAAGRSPLAMMVAGTLLYGVGPVMIQASSVSGPVFSLWRLLAGIPLFAAPLPLYVRMGGRWPGRRAWRWALWGGLAFGIHQVLFTTALKATSVTDVTLVGTLAPVVTAILAVPLFGERPGIGFRIWTVVAMAGASIVIVAASSGPEGDPAGMVMASSNVVFFSLFFLFGKMSRAEMDVLPFLFGMTCAASVVVGAVCLATGQPVGAVTQTDLLLAVGLALVPGGVAHFMTTWPMRWVPANIPALLQLMVPAISGLLAWRLLDEPIEVRHFVGGAITLVGVAGAVLAPGTRDFASGRSTGDRGGAPAEGIAAD
ncbi:MAG: DMT family transporter [Actinomycetota bacterium]